MDFINKLSTRIIREYDIICIEDLKVDNMLKNHNLAQSISDVSWSKFTTQLEYKAQWYGKVIKKVDTFYASSQTCHCCGYKNEGTKDLNVREWTCPKCHSNHDRDINVSIPWWRSHPIHKNRATESIWTEPCNPLLRAAKSTKRATFNL